MEIDWYISSSSAEYLHIVEGSDNSRCKSRGFETYWDFTTRRIMSYWNGAQVYMQPLHCVRLWTRRALCFICTDLLSCWIFSIVPVIWYIIHSRWLELKGKWNIHYLYLISLKVNANINISLSPLKWHILLMLIPKPYMGNKWNICLHKTVVFD